MRIAYLVNRYPAVSHSFIRREIAAAEQAGCTVSRFSIRPASADLPDLEDRAEVSRTQVVLGQGFTPLLTSTVRAACMNPRGFLSATILTITAIAAEPRRGWRHLAYLGEACWLASRLGGIEHIHAHFGTNPAAVARLVHRLTGISFSFTVHGPDEFDAPVALDLAGKIADARLTVAISSYGRSQLMRWSDPADWKRIAVVRCGVDRLFTQDTPREGRTAPTLCCVARLSAQKGLPLLIEAASALSRRRSFSLVLVGDGELRAELEAMIGEFGLAETVAITGYIDAASVRKHLLAARAMVLPSFAEGLPVVIMEALALRTPVIVTAIAGVPELVDAECGWVIPAGSVGALADAMEKALDCAPEILAQMGEAGRLRVLEAHDSARNGRALAEHFRAVA